MTLFLQHLQSLNETEIDALCLSIEENNSSVRAASLSLLDTSFSMVTDFQNPSLLNAIQAIKKKLKNRTNHARAEPNEVDQNLSYRATDSHEGEQGDDGGGREDVPTGSPGNPPVPITRMASHLTCCARRLLSGILGTRLPARLLPTTGVTPSETSFSLLLQMTNVCSAAEQPRSRVKQEEGKSMKLADFLLVSNFRTGDSKRLFCVLDRNRLKLFESVASMQQGDPPSQEVTSLLSKETAVLTRSR